jgi:penicillin V acylase-like amidase (Ntn superfamily)
MTFKPSLFFCLLLSFSCNNTVTSSANKLKVDQKPAENLTNKNPFHIISAIPLPSGFVRVSAANNSFTSWLRNIELKENKTVYLFDGRIKTNQQAQFAVMNEEICRCFIPIVGLINFFRKKI